MPKTLYVIKYDANTELYLLSFDSNGATWGSEDTAITFATMSDADNMISLIGSGPIGVPKKPH